MWGRFQPWMLILMTGLAWTGSAPSVRADVHLEWRPGTQQVGVGDYVYIGLYAVSDDGTDQAVGGVDAILSWDPRVLSLLGHENNGPYQWMLSWFPDDSGLDGLNDTWSNGNAFYQCLRKAAPNLPAEATPEGLLVTTFVFEAVGPATATRITLLPESGGDFNTSTRVLDGFNAGIFITGQLGKSTVAVLLCGVAADLDGDCDVDLIDFGRLVPCMGGPDGAALATECQVADIDGDGNADLRDVSLFQQAYTGW